jgi:hypothetical protein
MSMWVSWELMDAARLAISDLLDTSQGSLLPLLALYLGISKPGGLEQLALGLILRFPAQVRSMQRPSLQWLPMVDRRYTPLRR